ncbi:MAG: hypothetical protein ACD_41C00217G0001 [uncultured bacterium]|nr:MAG: hypothetical protein ACD_41C00217G0001 [uncultured bacterium]
MSTIMVRCAAKASATGRLFSSVHVNDVLPLLEAQGVMVTADQISLPVIKQVGDHVGAFTLPGQPAVHFTVTVTTA